MHTFVLSAFIAVWIFADSRVNGALTITYSGSNRAGSTTYILKCDISSFTGQAAWSKGGSPMATCFSSGCITPPSPPYSFRQVASAIYVDFSTLAASEHGIQWTCEHSGDTAKNFIVQVDSTLIIAVRLFATAIIVCITVIFLLLSSVVGYVCTNCYRRYKRKSLKDNARLLSESIMACHGDEIILTLSHPFSIIEGNTESVDIRSDDTVSRLHIKNVTEQHFGVYQCGILLESIDICKEVKCDCKVITKKDKTAKRESSTEVSLEEETRKEIKIKFHFEVDNEDLVTFREPRRYYFADKYKLGGVTFTGIQIIIVAAIYQLMSIISTAVVLLVVFYGHREYDTAIVIPVAAAMAVLFSLLGIGVYICTVKCCRKLKKDTKNASKTDLQCVLLLIITILPVAWFVLFVLIVVNKCRQSPVDGNDDKTIENQSTDEETKENHTNGIGLSLLSPACCQNSVDAKEDPKEAVPLSSKSIGDNKRRGELTSITADAKANKNVIHISKENEIENQGESHHAET